MEVKDIHILLIDDDKIVHKAMRRILEEKSMVNPLLTAKNGEEGLSILKSPDGPWARGLPLLVILDLNMPKMDGHEFLKEMRGDPKLNNIPVFILTTSKAPRDLGDAYDMAVIGYVIKEELSESLEKALTVLEQTWRFE
ncbi:MAG: response regulator, partial [Proteobacteria bacterium]|nr:response regulator [Pseudomonadota bacterium]